MAKEPILNEFNGFYPETLTFLGKLSKNNSKTWFDNHRDEYEKFLLSPAKEFVNSIQGFLNYINPALVVEPKFNKSFVRLNKDMRFAKKPYKDYFLIRFGRFKWDCEMYLVISNGNISIGAFVNNDKKSESRFTINVGADLSFFQSVCDEYGISRKYSITDLKDMSEVTPKFNPLKDTEKILDTRWFTFDKVYSDKHKSLFSKKFLEEAILTYNSLYPMFLFGTSMDIKKDIKEYKNRIGILKK